jgi:predicted permease
MGAVRQLFCRLVNAFRPGNREPDLAREIRSHLALLEDEFRRRGMSDEDARLAARRAFGGIERAKDLHRDARSFRWIDDGARDLRHAVRLLRRDPLFALTAALSLGVGIGANTATFTFANALLFRPPPRVVEPDRLVDIGTTRARGGFGPSSYANYVDVRERTRALDGVYAYSRFPQAMSLGGFGTMETENVFGSLVTLNYFTVLGAIPSAGRLFEAADNDGPGTPAVVVLSHRFWSRRFNGDPSVVGRPVPLNGHALTVVGVAPEGFHGTGVRTIDLWVPVTMAPFLSAQRSDVLIDRGAHWLMIGGRLKPGQSVSQADAEMDVIGRTLERQYPEKNRGTGLRLTAMSAVPGNSGPMIALLGLLTLIASFVLIVACANVAGALLARGAARRQEMALRIAIGAGRARLARQMLAESMLLFACGGAAGLILGRTLMSVLASRLPALPFPVELSLVLDGRVIAYTAGLSFLAALLSGLAPALQASKANVLPGLRDEPGLIGRLRLHNAFVVGQVALSIVLVIVGGLFARALQRGTSVDPGFDARGVELATVDLEQAGYTTITGPIFVRDLLDRLRDLADVQSVTIASGVPGGFEVRREVVEDRSVDWTIVEPLYFETLRISLTSGRDFSTLDRAGTQPVAIVSHAAAQQFWPGQEAIGKYLRHRTGEGAATERPLLVVGVAGDVHSTTVMDGVSRPSVYVPLQQHYVPNLTIVGRTLHGHRIVNHIRAVLKSVDPKLPLVSSETLDDSVALGLMPQRVVAAAAGGLGLIGLLLAGFGVYGVTAYAVTRQTREIGIRIALGAGRSRVVRMVLRQGLWLTLVGAAVGVMPAAAASHVLSAFLFGIPAIDPVTFIGTILLFAAIGVAACYVPVQRATQIDPVEALRRE